MCSSDLKNTINNWFNVIGEEAKNNILEFYKADKILEKHSNILYTNKSHSQAYHTSRLLDFTKKLNEILNQEEHVEAKCSGMFYFTFFYCLISYLLIF